MKTSMTLKSIALIALLGAPFAMPALAQGGPGMGGGMGGGPGMQNAGPGAGMGPGGGGMMFNQNDTRGWTLMTPEERTAFQIKMREVKTYDDCKLTQVEHRSIIEARARERGATLMTPRADACDRMKARGLIK